MKVRNGFVSNSSSSSFAIIGVELDSDEIKRIGMLLIKNKLIDYTIEDEEEIESSDIRCEVQEYLETAEKSLVISSGISELDEDSLYVGYQYGDMEIDETRSDFENSIRDKLDNLKLDICTKDIHMYVDGGPEY